MKPSVAKRAGQWTAVAALAALVSHYVEAWGDTGPQWHHVAAVIAAAVIGALVSLAEGKAGSAPADKPATDPNVPDGDSG